MAEWMLNDKQFDELYWRFPAPERDVQIALAQVRALMEWGMALCKDHHIVNIMEGTRRFDCHYCIEQLKQEVMGEDGN